MTSQADETAKTVGATCAHNFDADTPVATEDGSEPISDIEEGEVVG